MKTEKTIRRTVLIAVPSYVPVGNRCLEWEFAARTGKRHVYRVERATPGAGVESKQDMYLIDLEITCRGANRHDLTKMVHTYLPECRQHFITD